jgi:hypothetical protein
VQTVVDTRAGSVVLLSTRISSICRAGDGGEAAAVVMAQLPSEADAVVLLLEAAGLDSRRSAAGRGRGSPSAGSDAGHAKTGTAHRPRRPSSS